MKKDFIQKLIPYIIIGIYGVIIDVAIFNFAFNQVVSPIFEHFGANTSTESVKSIIGTMSGLISGTAGFINNFLMNEYFVYKLKWSMSKGAKRFLKYFTAIIIGSFIVGKFIIFNLVYTLTNHQNATISNLVAIAVGTFINYPINYFWTWNKKEKDEEHQL